MIKMSSSQKGAAMVEFAIVLPLLLLITFGIIEFGMLIYNQQMLTNASREGARAGIVASSPRVGVGTINTIVQNYCAANMVTFGTRNNPVTNVSGYSANALFGAPLTVNVTYQYSFLVVPNLIPGFSRLRTMQATSVMRYE